LTNVSATARETSRAYNSPFNSKVPERYKTAWDLQQVIRHVLAWDANPEGGFGVNFHEPLKSGKHGLATMKVSEQWLREMAEKEDNGIISVGGLVTRMRQANDPAVNPDAGHAETERKTTEE
jgi:hypothetical protein